MRNPKVLLIVDVQKDFLPGGALAVPHGDEVIDPLHDHALNANFVIASKDWHPKDHCSFKEQGGLWPPHCIQGTLGAELDPRVLAISDMVHNKGFDPNKEEYSAMSLEIANDLKLLGVKDIQIGGLATEYCVRETVLYSLAKGFNVDVLTDSIRAIDEEKGKEVLKELENAGANLL